jgi:hypothetical protein
MGKAIAGKIQVDERVRHHERHTRREPQIVHAIVGEREGVELAARLAYGRQERLSAFAPCVCVSVDQAVKMTTPRLSDPTVYV